ncbi:SMI1/KNR4 family protein, partial [Amycolatopsis rhizosphaerae]|uniref:SMI1/KNR4 family protein n=1 Tax=Amycolatopsis rhizosphaerae TaxID=2053003 RepID=UPI001643E02A
MTTPLDHLIRQARSPLGRHVTVDPQADNGPLTQLAQLLSRVNGLTVFNAGVQLYRAGDIGLGPELQHWNTRATWKDSYRGLADGLFCFGQDLFGRQFAIEHREHVVLFDPETADRTPIGTTLDDWAGWLLDDPDVNGTRAYATAWQDRFGALDHDQRLIPLQFFTLGGTYAFDNIIAKPADTCMRIRGPLAQQLHDLPEGAQVHLMPEQPGTTQLAYTELDVFADYNSFIIQDDAARFTPTRDWTRALITDLIATAPGAVGVGTARRTTVPVILDIRTTPPQTNLDDWDHVTQA